MSKLLSSDTSYRDWIQEVSKRFRQSQIRAAVKVNDEIASLTKAGRMYRWNGRPSGLRTDPCSGSVLSADRLSGRFSGSIYCPSSGKRTIRF